MFMATYARGNRSGVCVTRTRTCRGKRPQTPPGLCVLSDDRVMWHHGAAINTDGCQQAIPVEGRKLSVLRPSRNPGAIVLYELAVPHNRQVVAE